MSAREWTDEEALDAFMDMEYDESALHARLKIGRALLTLRHERDEAKADLAECFSDLGKMTEKWMDACRERDLLAAECRATRSWTDGKPPNRDEVWWGGDEWGHMMNARAAVDAAGVLGRDDK